MFGANNPQDPHPPLPADVSSGMRDFLLKCFQKVGPRGLRPVGKQLVGTLVFWLVGEWLAACVTSCVNASKRWRAPSDDEMRSRGMCRRPPCNLLLVCPAAQR